MDLKLSTAQLELLCAAHDMPGVQINSPQADALQRCGYLTSLGSGLTCTQEGRRQVEMYRESLSA